MISPCGGLAHRRCRSRERARLLLAVALAGATGCGHLHLGPPPNPHRASAPPTPACAALAGKVLTFTIVGGVLGSVGVSLGGMSPSIDSVAGKWSVAGMGAAAGAVSTGLGLAASYYAAQHEHQGCAQ